jgi:replicative DNA helicase
MIVLAGRPSTGKTAVAVNIVKNAAITRSIRMAIFSTEMSHSQLNERFISALSGVNVLCIRSGHLTNDEKAAIRNAASLMRRAKLYIDDSTTLTPMSLRARCRRLKCRYGVELFVADYLQLMEAKGKRSESRQQEITIISRHIKALARELDAPLVVLSQLNRAPEGREGRISRMSDLRESGSIEQEADVVILMHRPDYYHVDDEDYEPDNTA